MQQVLTLTTAESKQLILTDLYDRDWQARLDGKPVELQRFEGMYRSVSIPAGTHQLQLSYHPTSFRIGLLASVAGFTIWLATGIFLLRRSPEP